MSSNDDLSETSSEHTTEQSCLFEVPTKATSYSHHKSGNLPATVEENYEQSTTAAPFQAPLPPDNCNLNTQDQEVAQSDTGFTPVGEAAPFFSKEGGENFKTEMVTFQHGSPLLEACTKRIKHLEEALGQLENQHGKDIARKDAEIYVLKNKVEEYQLQIARLEKINYEESLKNEAERAKLEGENNRDSIRRMWSLKLSRNDVEKNEHRLRCLQAKCEKLAYDSP